MSSLNLTGRAGRAFGGGGGMVPLLRRRLADRRLIGVGLLALLIWRVVLSHGGTPDPTASGMRLGHGAVIVDSAILVLREGLETILVLAAVTGSFRGERRRMRRPVAAGGAVAFAAAVATWFIAIAITSAVGAASLDLQAATGLIAIAVLLVVMNWFFHKVYWTGWIAHHHRRRRRLLADAGEAGVRRTMLGLALLGFTSVYREGFEVVLFLQNLRLRYGSGTVLDGVALGLAMVSVVGILTFALQRHLPYKKLLVATGLLLGVVLLVMVGESVQEMQQAGWLATTPLPDVTVPGWLGLWFSVFANWQTVGAQALAATIVVGSYVAAERRVHRRSETAEPPDVAKPIVGEMPDAVKPPAPSADTAGVSPTDHHPVRLRSAARRLTPPPRGAATGRR